MLNCSKRMSWKKIRRQFCWWRVADSLELYGNQIINQKFFGLKNSWIYFFKKHSKSIRGRSNAIQENKCERVHWRFVFARPSLLQNGKISAKFQESVIVYFLFSFVQHFIKIIIIIIYSFRECNEFGNG